MDERSFKEKLTAAMEEPSAPPALIRRTIVRAEAIRNGRIAEETLENRRSAITFEERRRLAAESVVGRLMHTVVPPDGVTAEMMTRQLAGKPLLRKLAELPTDRLLEDLRCGRVNQMLTATAENTRNDTRAPQPVSGRSRGNGPQL